MFIKTFKGVDNTIYFGVFTQKMDDDAQEMISAHDRKESSIIEIIKKGYNYKSYQEDNVLWPSLQGLSRTNAKKTTLIIVHIGVPFIITKMKQKNNTTKKVRTEKWYLIVKTLE